jgi:ribosome-binding factor A
MHGLRHAGGYLQSKLAGRLQTRFTPVIRFVLDEGVKKSIEMTRLINEALAQSAPPSHAAEGEVGVNGETGSADGAVEEEPVGNDER